MTERIAIVTGGTRGIGRAISLRLAQGGVTPVMVYLSNEAAADETLVAVRKFAAGAQVLRADVSSEDAVGLVIKHVLSDFGTVDILVNNAFASSGTPRKVHETSLDVWNGSISTNLTGVFMMTKACLPPMIERQSGRIIFIGSLASRGEPGRAAYVATKNGIIGLAKTVAVEYARDGVTANVVNPGYINAGAFERLDPSIRERAQHLIPQRRFGTPEEVAEAVWYFASPEAGYTTGQVLGVDGGAR